jgi:hypothetical protein
MPEEKMHQMVFLKAKPISKKVKMLRKIIHSLTSLEDRWITRTTIQTPMEETIAELWVQATKVSTQCFTNKKQTLKEADVNKTLVKN